MCSNSLSQVQMLLQVQEKTKLVVYQAVIARKSDAYMPKQHHSKSNNVSRQNFSKLLFTKIRLRGMPRYYIQTMEL